MEGENGVAADVAGAAGDEDVGLVIPAASGAGVQEKPAAGPWVGSQVSPLGVGSPSQPTRLHNWVRQMIPAKQPDTLIWLRDGMVTVLPTLRPSLGHEDLALPPARARRTKGGQHLLALEIVDAVSGCLGSSRALALTTSPHQAGPQGAMRTPPTSCGWSTALDRARRQGGPEGPASRRKGKNQCAWCAVAASALPQACSRVAGLWRCESEVAEVSGASTLRHDPTAWPSPDLLPGGSQSGEILLARIGRQEAGPRVGPG
jgi:hypothetical protein